jgi:tetratricopeptide (TPR) repeat protein
MDERQQSVEELRKRIAQEPFRSALLYAWGTVDLEGVLAHYVANPELARSIAAKDLEEGLVNTDNRMLIEFSFARTLGRPDVNIVDELHQQAGFRKMHYPAWLDRTVDWQLVIDNISLLSASMGFQANSRGMADDHQARIAAYNFFNQDQMAADQILQMWSQQDREPQYPLELAMLAEAYAEKGDSRALSLVNQLNKFHPVTAKAILARYYLRSGDPARALEALKTALTELRVYPWVQTKVLYRSFDLGLELVNAIPDRAMELFELFSEPFCVKIYEYERNIKLIQIAAALSPSEGIKALQQVEPHVPWAEEILRYRLQVYQKSNHSLAPLAQKELDEFLKHKRDSFAGSSKKQ